MQLTVTAKVKIKPTPEQVILLQKTIRAYQKGCKFCPLLYFKRKSWRKRSCTR